MEIIDDEPQDDAGAQDPSQAELDGQKIRQFTALRRSAIRQRSWCLIAAGVCGVGALKLVINTVRLILHGHWWGLWQTLYMLVAAVAVFLAFRFLRRARLLSAEMANSSLKEPKETPDFSSLGDGSERWKKLEELR